MIKYIASIFIAAILLVSGSALAGDAVATNGWHRSIPADNCDATCAAAARSISRIQRGQTAYFPVIVTAGDQEQVVNTTTGALANCDESSDTCTSAPLFIKAPSATICVDTDIGTVAATSGIVHTYICADSTCTVAKSVNITNYPNKNKCAEFSAADGEGGYNTFNVGNSWVYVDVTTAPAAGETYLVWITAN